MESEGANHLNNPVADELDSLALEISDTARIEKAGVMAADFIRSHIYKAEGFAPLSAVTVEYRGAGSRPLQDTGSLRDSIVSELKNKNSVSVGTTKLYAPIQNDGGEIHARKEWLFIPAKGTRRLERLYGSKPKDVLDGLRSSGHSVYRAGRTVCYRKKGKDEKSRIAYYLKKSVVIPARKFFYLSEDEIGQIQAELFPDI